MTDDTALESADHVGAARRAAAAAAREAEQAGDLSARRRALGDAGAAAALEGRFAEAGEALEDAVELARGDEQAGLVRARARLALTAALRGRMADARTLLSAAGSAPAGAEVAGSAREIRAFVEWLAGNLPGALRHADAAVAARGGQVGPGHGWVLAVAAVAAADLGRTEDARSRLEHVSTVYAQGRSSLFRPVPAWAGALIAWPDDPGAAAARLRDVAEALLACGALPLAAFALTDLAEAAFDAGDADAARWAARRLRQAAIELDESLYANLAAIGDVAGAEDDARQRPADVLARSVPALHALGYRSYSTRGMAVLGRVSGGEDATYSLSRAVADFGALGIAWRRDRAAAALERLQRADDPPSDP